jgi:hypothetical protein
MGVCGANFDPPHLLCKTDTSFLKECRPLDIQS